jgi:hypothetical protein
LGDEGFDESSSTLVGGLNGLFKCRLVRLGWPSEAAELADELQRSGADFFVGRRWVEVEQGSNVTAHGEI